MDITKLLLCQKMMTVELQSSMSNMRNEPFNLNSNKVPESVFTQHFKIENKGTTTYIKVNDYKCDGYMHITKINKGGRPVKITFNSEEMFNLFDSGNSKKFKSSMEGCLKKITSTFAVVPGSQQEEITYENIPKSVRVLEMQKTAEQSLEEKKALAKKIAEYQKELEILEKQKKEAFKEVKQQQEKSGVKTGKKRKIEETKIVEDDEDEEESSDEDEDDEEDDEEET